MCLLFYIMWLLTVSASFTPGHALQVGVQWKLTTHLPACWATKVDFIHLVAEAMGGLAEAMGGLAEAMGGLAEAMGGLAEDIIAVTCAMGRAIASMQRGLP